MFGRKQERWTNEKDRFGSETSGYKFSPHVTGGRFKCRNSLTLTCAHVLTLLYYFT